MGHSLPPAHPCLFVRRRHVTGQPRCVQNEMTYCVELPFFCPWVSEGVIRSYSRVCEYYKTTFMSFE